MNRKKTLLMLGAGVYQVPAIQRGILRGIEMIVCSLSRDDPGCKYATHHEEVDIRDKQRILEVATRYGVDGVLTVCSDVGVPTVGYVNDRLGLPGISEDTAVCCSNKMLFRERLSEKRISSPGFLKITNANEAHDAFIQFGRQVVLKAVDNSGSRGVVKVTHERDLAQALETAFQFTRESYVLAEELIVGEEFGSQSLVLDGKLVYNFCHNDMVFGEDICTPVGHSYPFRHDEKITQQANEIVKQLIEVLGLKNAQLNCDFDVRQGTVYVLEVGARIGATSLPQLTHCHTGIDWMGLAIDLALGIVDRTSIENRLLNETPTASTLMYSTQEGRLRSIQLPSGIQEDPSVWYLTVDVKPGEHVRKFTLGPDRMGEVVFSAETLDLAEFKVRQFLNSMYVEVESHEQSSQSS